MIKVRTPCIGICSTTSLGDPICRGCKRYDFEVINWNSYSDEQKLAVLSRVEKLNTQIIENKLHIHSIEDLRTGLKLWKVPFDETLSEYCWLHNLLKRCHRELDNLDKCGVRVKSEYRHLSLPAIIDLIEKEILVLCEAHHDRYFDRVDSLTGKASEAG